MYSMMAYNADPPCVALKHRSHDVVISQTYDLHYQRDNWVGCKKQPLSFSNIIYHVLDIAHFLQQYHG